MPEEEKKSGFNWLACCGGGCLVLVIAGIVGVYITVSKGEQIVRYGAAKAITAVAEEMTKEMGLPEKERQAVLKEVQGFADKVQSEEASLEQIAKVGEELAKGPALAALVGRGFRSKYLDPSGLSEEAKKEGARTVSRFTHGVINEKIPQEKAEEVMDIISDKTTDAAGNPQRQFKETLTKEELEKALHLMKTHADEGGVEEKTFEIDLAAEIRKAIERGMETAPPPDAAE